jgi:hypothetical protein
MAIDNDILDHLEIINSTPPPVVDTYLDGIQCLKNEIRGKPSELGRFLLHLPLYSDQDNAEFSDADEDLIIDGIHPDPTTNGDHSTPDNGDDSDEDIGDGEDEDDVDQEDEAHDCNSLSGGEAEEIETSM